MPIIYTNKAGNKVVEIDTVVFSGKRKIDWKGVENYLKKYVGNGYVLDETDEVIRAHQNCNKYFLSREHGA